jgi:hypothetical protein
MASAYRARRERLVVPAHGGQRGHPILLCALATRDVLALPAGATLRDYTNQLIEHRLELSVPDGGILCDLDTPADYAAAVARLAGASTAASETGEIAAAADGRAGERSEACPSQPMVPQPIAD